MRIALVDTTPNPKVYPLALLKIGAWRQAEGDHCQLFSNALPKPGEFAAIWLTTCFTFDIPHALSLVRAAKTRAASVRVGGISATLLPERFEMEGVDVHRGLIPEAELFAPDYGLMDIKPQYSITHTTRGCIRKCGFCMVHRLEPEFHNRPDWANDLAPGVKKILFFDNNWLAKDNSDWQHDVDAIRALVKSGQITQIDFNQGIDARLMTEELADALVGIPMSPVRFAFDGMQEDGYYQRAVRMMAERGFSKFTTYVLYNFKDTPKDFYYRLRQSAELSQELRVSVESFPMRYQPILEPDSRRQFVGEKWTRIQRRGFMTIMGSYAFTGLISTNSFNGVPPIEEFEYWFGKNADEFDKLLAYPKLRQLVRRRKGALRMRRIKMQSAPTNGTPELME